MAQTLGEIKSLLAAHGLRPKKHLGQNFLHDASHMQRIMAAAGVEPGDLVLEVGPGTGALTGRLLEAGARVVAVEVDTDLEAILRGQFERYGASFTLLMMDVLEQKHALASSVVEALGTEPFKLIANLPYQVASPLLINLAADHRSMTRAVVMVQREVADRMCALPGGKTYGPLSVMVQAMCEVKRVGVLPPGCFWPAPTVESAVVRLVRRAEPRCSDARALSRLLQKVFSQRRKQLGSVLGRDHALPAGIDAAQRPEQLSVEQLCELADWWKQRSGV